MREMINKIKQNILPILTVIMVLLSALCVVFILKPSQNQAQASIGTQYESVSGDGLTVYIGTYKYRWGTTKNGDGKTYAKAVSGAVGYNMPDYMYITGDGFTAPCFCITPSVDNGGRHTLSNITITPYTGAAAGIAKAAGNFSYRSYPTFCAIQTAVRQTVGGGSLSSTDRLFDYSGSSKKVISACMPYMVDTYLAYAGQDYNSLVGSEVKIWDYASNISSVGDWIPLCKIQNVSSSKVSYSVSGSNLFQVLADDKSVLSTRTSLPSISSGQKYRLTAGQSVIICAKADSSGSFSLTGTFVTSKEVCYRASTGGQDFIFAMPGTGKFTASGSWTPQTTTVTANKTDSETGRALSGATFELVDSTGKSYGRKTTSSSGSATWTGIPVGKQYTIKEVTPPTNYEAGADKTITPTLNGSNSVTITNKLKRGNFELDKQFLLYTGATSGITPSSNNITFALRSSTGQTYTLTKSGTKYSVQNIPVGTYTLIENGTASIAGEYPAAFVASNKSCGTVTIQANQTATKIVQNVATPGSLVLHKYEAYSNTLTTTTPLSGAQFTLSCSYGPVSCSGSNGSYTFTRFGSATTLTTNSSGQISISGLPPVSYTFTEVSAPAGYSIQQSTYPVTVKPSQSASVTAYNIAQRGNLTFNKKNSANNGPYSSAQFVISRAGSGYVSMLSGSNGSYSMPESPYFSPSQSGAAIITTDSNGSCTISNLIIGTYTVQEISSGSQYFNLQTTPVNATVTANGTANAGTISNAPKTGSFTITKKGEWNETVKTATFTLYRNGSPVKLTGSNGTYSYDPSNYTQNYTESSAGVQFSVNANGQATVSNLPTGSETAPYTYTVKEVSTDVNYEVSSSSVPVSITANGNTPINFTNKRKRGGSVLVEKASSLNSSVLLSGAQFTISVKSEAGSTIGGNYVVATGGTTGQYDFSSLTTSAASATKFTTSAAGNFSVEGLPYGTYILQEVKAPTNYTLSNTTIEFTINSSANVDLLGSERSVYPLINAPLIGQLEFGKRGNIDGEVIADCVFNIQCIESAQLNVFLDSNPKFLSFSGSAGNYTLEDSNYTEDNVDPDGSSFDVQTDGSGNCVIKKLPVGKYKITEKGCSNTSSEYVLVTDNQSGINYTLNLTSNFDMIVSGNSVVVNPDDTVTGTTKILTNTRKTGQLEFTKFDADTGAINKRLSTCKFVIKLEDRKKYVTLTGTNGDYTYKGVTSKANATQFTVNSETCKAVFKNLPIGTYTIEEVSPDVDNIYKLNTTPVTVKVLDSTAKVSMSNTPWGGKLTFTKKTEHGTLYPNSDKENEFYVKATAGDNAGKFVKLTQQEDKNYQFESFVQSQSEATKFTTNNSATLNGQTTNASVLIYDIPKGTYQVIETKTGSNYDLAKAEPTEYVINLLRDQVDVEKLNINTGLSKDMINYVLKSKVNLTKTMSDTKLTINGLEQDILPSGFKASIVGTSVTTAPINIKFESDDSGKFIIKEFTINGNSQTADIGKSEFNLPFGDYTVSEYDINSHAKWGSHAHLDTISKTTGGTTVKVWDRMSDTVAGGTQSITHKCTSSDAVTFNFTNILDHPDLNIIKSTGSVANNSDAETLAFIDTDITYNVSGISNELDTHNADITIIDYPEKNKTANGIDCKLAIRSISIPGYNKIENGSDAISYSIKILGTDGSTLFEKAKAPLPETGFTIDDLSPNVDSETIDYGMCNIDRIEIKYYNFPARSKMADNAAIVYVFRLGGDLIEYKTAEVNAKGKAVFKTFNDVEMHHSFLTDVPTDDANQPIKKVNIHKLNIEKSIDPASNGVDYSKNNYTFTPDYTSFNFEIHGYLINEDDEWEEYTTTQALNPAGKVEIALPYGVYRLQELHTDGYNDQVGYDLICDSDGIFVANQNDSNDYVSLSGATKVIGEPKLLNYKAYEKVLDADGVRQTISPKPSSLKEIVPTSKKGFIFRDFMQIENTIAVGTLKLDKVTTVLADKGDVPTKAGYHLVLEGTSYAGVKFRFPLISDRYGTFVPDSVDIKGYDAASGTFKIPEGVYTLSENRIPDMVVPDTITFNDEIVWNRETDVTDPSTTDITTRVKLIKDINNVCVVTNTTNTKVYDEYEFTEIKFNKVFYGENGVAQTSDFEKIALDELESYNFRITLTNQETGLKYTGLLNSDNGISFYSLPFGRYLFEENSELLFSNSGIEILPEAHNVKLEKEDDKYFITLLKVPNDSEATATFNVSNKLSDFRGYSSIDSVPNLIAGDKSSTKSLLTITVTNFDETLLSSASVEIYAKNDLSTPINFKMVDGRVEYAASAGDSTFTEVSIGETGYVKIYNLPDGDYIVKQTKVKEGYRVVRTNSPVTVKKNDGGSDLFLYQSTVDPVNNE